MGNPFNDKEQERQEFASFALLCIVAAVSASDRVLSQGAYADNIHALDDYVYMQRYVLLLATSLASLALFIAGLKLAITKAPARFREMAPPWLRTPLAGHQTVALCIVQRE